MSFETVKASSGKKQKTLLSRRNQTKGGPGPGQDKYLSRHRKGAQ